MTIAWITGAHGFIGRHLALSLRAGGYQVAGIGHGAWPEAEAAQWGVSTWLNGDITSSNLNLLALSTGLPALVFHLAGGASVAAAMANPREDFTRTVLSTADLLEWLRQRAPESKLVAVSSAAVYGSSHATAIPEEAHPEPYSPYGAHKLMMEELCRSYATNFGLPIVIPRLFSVYGPELRKQLLWDLCSKLAAQSVLELGGTGNERRDWVDVRDAVLGLQQFASLASAQAPVINHGSGQATSVREIAELVLAAWSAAGGEAPAALSFNGRSRPGDPDSLVADISKMRALGITCRTPLTQGVGEYVAWYRAEHGDFP